MATRGLKSIHIGTSGWNYKHWKQRFYPEDLPQRKWLEFYAEHFRTVEINNSFYRLPEKETFKRWREQTPDDFILAVKGSRYLTHLKRLKDAEAGRSNFLERAVPQEFKLLSFGVIHRNACLWLAPAVRLGLISWVRWLCSFIWLIRSNVRTKIGCSGSYLRPDGDA